MGIVSQKYKPGDFSEGQWHETLVTLGKLGFSPQMADLVANSKSGKAREIVKICGGNPYADLVADWEKFYEKRGINVDFSGLAIPESREGFRHIFVPKGMTPQGGYDLCATKSKCWKYCGDKSLNDVVAREDRTAEKGSYVILVQDGVEPNEELKGKSADNLATMRISGNTLTEALVHEAKYNDETGQHLNLVNRNLCSGSRYSRGDVPLVRWDSGYSELHVSETLPLDAFGTLRSRKVVS